MKKSTTTTNNKNTLNWIDDQFAITGVKNYSEDVCFFNLYVKSPVGNLAIYGCKVISGGKGDFIAFPSRSYTAKDGSMAYSNYASIIFENGMQTKIIKAVQAEVNDA